MKKFKFKKNNSKLRLVIIIIILVIIFILVSFVKLEKSFTNLINITLNKFSNSNNRIKLTSNLDYLLADYAFKENKISYNIKTNKIYLYNTHDDEKYSDNKDVLDTSRLLENKLTKLGIKVILEKRRISDYSHLGLPKYNISKMFLEEIMNKEKDINYYIDIHRDSVKDTTITINNKKYAKIMFVLGLENPNYQKNKKIMEKMNNYLNINYPGISRGIYEKKGSGVNGVYNQDLRDTILLIEVGGIENNINEIDNSTEILSLMIYDILGDDNEEYSKS